MKYVADCIRSVFPHMHDTQIYRLLVRIHSLSLYAPCILFFLTKDLLVRIMILHYLTFVTILRLIYKECPLTVLEREFVVEHTPNLLETVYDLWGWESRSRKEEVLSFTGFNMGVLVSMLAVTLIG